MLIFTRNIGQQTIITLPDGTTVTVTSLGISGNQMRLGFTADKNVEIHREEVYARIQAEKKQKALQEQAA